MSLFTKTPVDATLNMVQNRLKTDRTLHKRTKLTVEDIGMLLTFVAKSTYFQFKGTVYRQKEGFAMGGLLSAIMSVFFTESLEAKAITTAPADLQTVPMEEICEQHFGEKKSRLAIHKS